MLTYSYLCTVLQLIIYTTMNNDFDSYDADEQECVEFILKNLPTEYREKISDDDVYFVLDLIDYYYAFETDLVDQESDTMGEASIDEDEMLKFIMKSIEKDNEVNLTENEVVEILNGEYNFGVKKGIYIE